MLPNIITVFRIILIPFLVLLLSQNHLIWAFCLLLLSALTDVLDGWLARKFNMVTRVGTILDPIADKLMQFTVFVCLFVYDLIPLWLVALLFVKEVTMAVGTFVLLKRNVVIKANSSGKFATVIFYLIAFVVFCMKAMPNIPFSQTASVATVLAAVAVVAAFYAMGSYAKIFFKVIKGKETEKTHE